MAKADAYQTIAEMWTFPDSQSFRKMIEALLTPEDAELLVECRKPVTVPELAQKLGADEKTLADRLETFSKRGLIFRGKTQWQFRMGLHFNFAGMPISDEYAPSEEYYQWKKIWDKENPDREVKQWLNRFQETGHQIHRVYPSRLAILSNPAIKKEDLLWHEDIEQIFRRAPIIGAGICGCKTGKGMSVTVERATRCSHPLWNCFQFNKEFINSNLERGVEMRIYTVEQALEKSDEAERAGLIHEGPTNSAVMPGILCSCCADACQMLNSCQASGRMHELYAPSRFQARIVEEECIGCQECVEQCPFESIDMVKVAGSKKLKAKIRAEDCYGCGVCVVGCQQKAIKYDLVRPPEHIPPAPAAMRMGGTPLK